MLLSQASKLIDTALIHGVSGQIFIPIIESFKILDIAKYYAQKSNKEIKIIGLRTCEKIDETLISEFEIGKTEKRLIDKIYYYIIQPFYNEAMYKTLNKPYTSADISDIKIFHKLFKNV
jgi:FlaA1/EpsC-like NDP-sugar epimerase